MPFDIQVEFLLNLLWLKSAIPSSAVAAWVVREGKNYRNYRLAFHFY
jgi:hypothetical protein